MSHYGKSVMQRSAGTLRAWRLARLAQRAYDGGRFERSHRLALASQELLAALKLPDTETPVATRDPDSGGKSGEQECVE